MDVIVEADCGNAPKKALVRDWLIAAAEGDSEAVSAALGDAARLEVVGVQTHQGRAAVADAMTDSGPIDTFRIALLLSHGKHVAAEGEIRWPGGEATRFAHLVGFDGHGKNATISDVVTFAIPVERQEAE